MNPFAGSEKWNHEKCHRCGVWTPVQLSGDPCREVFCSRCTKREAAERKVYEAGIEEECRIDDALREEGLRTGWKKDWK